MKLLVNNRVEDLHECCKDGRDILLHQHNKLVPPLRGDEVRSRASQLFRGCLKKHQTQRDCLWGTDKLERERERERERESLLVLQRLKTTFVHQCRKTTQCDLCS